MRLYLLLLTFLLAQSVKGQRAPIRYIPIDSISNLLPGQEVKLDFKGKTINYGRVATAYPWLKRAIWVNHQCVGDTVFLTIDKEKIQFIEIKGQGTDYYMFSREHLESTTYRKQHLLTVPTTIVKEITSDSIQFRLTIELTKKKTNGKWTQISSREKDIWVKRKDLDGVLIHELDSE